MAKYEEFFNPVVKGVYLSKPQAPKDQEEINKMS